MGFWFAKYWQNKDWGYKGWHKNTCKDDDKGAKHDDDYESSKYDDKIAKYEEKIEKYLEKISKYEDKYLGTKYEDKLAGKIAKIEEKIAKYEEKIADYEDRSGHDDDCDDDDHAGHGHRHSEGRGHDGHKGVGWGHVKFGCKDPDDEPGDDEPDDVEINTPPEIIAPTNPNIEVLGFKTGTFAADVDAIDADGDTLIFSILGNPGNGEDGDLFEIDAATGVITVAAPGVKRASEDGDTTYTVNVEVSDGLDTDTIQLELTIDFTAA